MKKTAKTAAKTATTKPEAKKPCTKKCAAKKCETKKPALKSVTFTVHAEAGQDVRLAGSFTDWETKAKKMTFKKTNGVYSATVKLAPGEYQYKFIIGDKWTTDDQNAEFVPNDKGTFNSKLVIK
ncbi:MAG: glycogen-binding domain-containing protein [Kiritimatiellae bacterium]|nr:glycogen-binding domain-containing protein [Kiritimatiellia bacterium]